MTIRLQAFLLFALFLQLLSFILGGVTLRPYDKGGGVGILTGLFLSWIGIITALVIGSGENSRVQQAQA